jgi:hypothetical protein
MHISPCPSILGRLLFCSNLERDALRSEALVIGALDIDQIRAPGQCIIAFTCGHGFRREVFTCEIMPQLEQRMRGLSPPVDKTLPMVLSEFSRMLAASSEHDSKIPEPCQFPCPVCLLKQLQLDVRPPTFK